MRDRHAKFRWQQHRAAAGLGVQSIRTGAYCKAAGVGFPLARVVGVLCLATGALIDATIGPHAGKGNSESGLFRRRGAAGVDVLFEQNGARITDFRRGTALGKRDHTVRWPKPRTRPPWMSVQQYEKFAEELTVREVKVDGQVLVTTLLDARRVSKSELDQLHACRWDVELDLRNIKTTLGVEVLRCLTPPMVEKELWVHLLAYNVIRLLMAQAAHQAQVHPRELSFKHTVQLWTEWTARCVDVTADAGAPLWSSATLSA